MSRQFGDTQEERVLPDFLDTQALACACNEDDRFLAAGWAETPGSIERLLLSDAFQSSLAKLVPVGGARLQLNAVIAGAYRCRIGERGIPRRIPESRWQGSVGQFSTVRSLGREDSA